MALDYEKGNKMEYRIFPLPISFDDRVQHCTCIRDQGTKCECTGNYLAIILAIGRSVFGYNGRIHNSDEKPFPPIIGLTSTPKRTAIVQRDGDNPKENPFY